jgi:hypothetical protein
VQKEWTSELGTPAAEASFGVLNAAHDLLKAAKRDEIAKLLAGRTIRHFLGESWTSEHPDIVPVIGNLEASLNDERAA